MVIGVGLLDNRERAPTARAPDRQQFPSPRFGPANVQEALVEADRQIALGRERVRAAPGEWANEETLARGLVARAGLTGNYTAWAEAKALLDAGMASAPKGAGPIVADATLALSTHRLDRAESDLTLLKRMAVPPDRVQRAGMAGLEGDIAFYRGDMAAAARFYAKGAQYGGGPVIDWRRAVLAQAQARFADADAALLRAVQGERRHSPQLLAQAALRLGGNALAQGKWAAADQWFARADRLFPGYWLTAVHRAQAVALQGDTAAGARQMAAVADQSGIAEAMDAAAMYYRFLGQREPSRYWASRAAALWQQRLALLPEAAYGHALEHELAFGEPARALDLAQRNVATRPYGESRLLLASALLMNNRPRDALAQLQRAEASGWRSASLYALRAEAAALAGDTDLSETAREQALALNPRIFDPRIALVWFSHG